MDAAESVTIRITAIDSLKSCWRLGQTTSFNSSMVEGKKPVLAAGFTSSEEMADSVVSSGVGVVTELKPEAGARADKPSP